MNFPIDQIVTELRSQLAPIEAEENRLRATLTELKDQRKKLEAALSVLGGGPQKARPPRQTKACATKPEVVQIVADLLVSNGPMELPDLEGLTKERLVEANRSLSGLGLRLKEVLREEQFQVSQSGLVSLVETSSTPVA